MALAAAGAALAGCANEQPPPGTLPDVEPPTIRSIEPADDSVVAGFDGRVRVRWNEPVRIEAGAFARDLIASPVEPYEAETGFADVRIRPRDGWRDSTVYCMQVPAGISDLLNNRTQETESFCFSTGAPIIDSYVAGTVLDAITGRGVPEALVLFIAPPDSTPYGALTTSEGRFSLRALPEGPYEALAFLDRNRNFRLDRTLEPYDSARVSAFEGARPDLLMRIVEPDTTPPLLLRAEAWDSLTIRLEFDDPLIRPQPGVPTVSVADSATGGAVAIEGVQVGEPASTSFPGAGPDSLAVPPVTPGAAPDSAAGDPELPSRFVTVRLRNVLEASTYRVRADGLVNLRGLVGGGDTTFVAEPPARDSAAAVSDSLARDTLGVAADSADARPDTLVAPDSLAAPPDTPAAPPDTLDTPPDTLGTPPDTARAPPDTLATSWRRRRPAPP